jgi:hypothetical protein
MVKGLSLGISVTPAQRTAIHVELNASYMAATADEGKQLIARRSNTCHRTWLRAA